jgi:hypothetical protein
VVGRDHRGDLMKTLFSRAVLVLIFLSIVLVSSFQNCADTYRSAGFIAASSSSIKDPVTDDDDDNNNDGLGGSPEFPVDPGTGPVGGTPSCEGSTKIFNVIVETTASSVFDYSAKYKMDVACPDIVKDKFAFMVLKWNNVNYLYNPTSKGWAVWNGTTGSLSAFAISLPKIASQYPFNYFNFASMDFVELGGAQVYSGYGIGSTADAAANEMLAYRDSTHAAGRYNLVYQVPLQPASVVIQTFGNSASTFNASATVFVRHSDYTKQGFYFIGAGSPDGQTWATYDGSGSNGWVIFNGSNAVSVGGKQALKNKVLTMSATVKTADVANWHLYAGYAVGENLNAAFQIFYANSQGTRNSNPYIIPLNPSTTLDPNNWTVTGTVSGVLASYTARANIGIATAHVNKQGFYLLGAQIGDKLHILDIAKNQWQLWDGAMASYDPANKKALVSTTGNGITLGSNLDVTSLGGAILLAGYGVGDNILGAVNDCVANVRWKTIATIEKQSLAGVAVIPNFIKTSTALVEVAVQIFPDYRDYGLAGKYYIGAMSPDGATILIYNGTSWITYNDTLSDSLYTASSNALTNYGKIIRTSGVELASVSGWSLMVGHGKSVKDMVDRRLYVEVRKIP